jgi:hypothetical protein
MTLGDMYWLITVFFGLCFAEVYYNPVGNCVICITMLRKTFGLKGEGVTGDWGN